MNSRQVHDPMFGEIGVTLAGGGIRYLNSTVIFVRGYPYRSRSSYLDS
jgi:hypothetical protein